MTNFAILMTIDQEVGQFVIVTIIFYYCYNYFVLLL